jgi:hypothetical protein
MAKQSSQQTRHTHPFEVFREQFERLDWSQGLDLSDLRALVDCPPGVFGAIPDNRTYHSFEELWEATRDAPSGGLAGGLATGAVNVGGTHGLEIDPDAPPNSDV